MSFSEPLTIRTKRHLYSSLDIFDEGAKQLDLKSEGGEAIGGLIIWVCIPLTTPQSCGLAEANLDEGQSKALPNLEAT